jgi:hypothetical protein
MQSGERHCSIYSTQACEVLVYRSAAHCNAIFSLVKDIATYIISKLAKYIL